MLRHNKALLAKAVIFLAILIAGVYFLWSSSRTAGDPPAYTEAEETPDATPEPPYRLPITDNWEAMACQCANNVQPLRALSPPRDRSRPVEVETLLPGPGEMLLEADGSLWSLGHNPPVQILDNVAYLPEGGGGAIRADGSLWTWDMGFSGMPPGGQAHMLDDIVYFSQSHTRAFAIGADGGLWTWAVMGWPWWSSMIPDAEPPPMRVMDSVAAIGNYRDFRHGIGSHDFTFILQCNGRLWRMRDGTRPEHIMDAVAAFYMPPATSVLIRDVLIIQTDGSLWGVSPSLTPTPRHLLDDVVSIHRIEPRDYIIQADGSLWFMGQNVFGQLGDGSGARRDPVWVMDDVAQVVPGTNATFAITTGGCLWAWGGNSFGQLGDGTNISRQSPVYIMPLVRSVHHSHSSTFAIRSDGSLWAWGDSRNGQLWDAAADNRYYPTMVRGDVAEAPVFVMDNVAEVHLAGYPIIVVLGTDGGLWTWGDEYGLAPRLEEEGSAFNPVRVLDDVVYVSSASIEVYAIQADGSVWTMLNHRGHFWEGTWLQRAVPVNISYAFSYAAAVPPRDLGDISIPMTLPTRSQPLFIAAPGLTYFYVDTEYRLWCWGTLLRNTGLYGGISPVILDAPVHIMDDVVYVHAERWSGWDNYVIRTDGSLWAWGFGISAGLYESGQAARVSAAYSEPVKVLDSVAAFYRCNRSQSYFVIREDRSLWAWGSNWAGSLGDGTREYREYPVPIMENVAALYVQDTMVFALQYDGSLWAWGERGMHEGILVLDGGPFSSRAWGAPHIDDEQDLYPTLILDGVAYFALNGDSAFAIQANGTLWAWGDNSAGQLGDGTRINRYTPVRIMDGVVHVYASGPSTYAIRADGSLWAWGFNAMGQLGNGDFVSQLSPVEVAIGPVAEVFAASGVTFAVLEDNSFWAWGLGYGAVPVRIAGDDAPVTLVRQWGREMRYLVLQADGRLWVLGHGAVEMQLFMEDVVDVYSAWDRHFAITTDGGVWVWGNVEFGMVGRQHSDYPVRLYFEM